MKKYILGIITGVIISSVITVSAAVLLSANDVTLESDKTAKTNVKESLDELYDIADNKLEYLENKVVTYAFGTPTIESSSDWTTIYQGVIPMFIKRENKRLHVCIYLPDSSLKLNCFTYGTENISKNVSNCSIGNISTQSDNIGKRCSDRSGNYYCYFNADGSVSCSGNNHSCSINNDGIASCS